MRVYEIFLVHEGEQYNVTRKDNSTSFDSHTLTTTKYQINGVLKCDGLYKQWKQFSIFEYAVVVAVKNQSLNEQFCFCFFIRILII